MERIILRFCKSKQSVEYNLHNLIETNWKNNSKIKYSRTCQDQMLNEMKEFYLILFRLKEILQENLQVYYNTFENENYSLVGKKYCREQFSKILLSNVSISFFDFDYEKRQHRKRA